MKPRVCHLYITHIQTQIHVQSLTTKQATVKSGRKKKTLKEAVKQEQYDCFQVPLNLVSFLDSAGIVTIAECSRVSQQAIVFSFLL